jgi:hypothetical protein
MFINERLHAEEFAEGPGGVDQTKVHKTKVRSAHPSRRGHQIVIAYSIDSRAERGQNEGMLPRRKRGCRIASAVICCWLVLLTLSASAAIRHVTTGAHA